MMGREADWNMVMIPSACSIVSGFNNFKQYIQNDGGTVSAPELCFHNLELGTSANLRLVQLLAVTGRA